MLIDIIYLLGLLLSLFNGYRKGLIWALFSLAALFIGLAAALKLSAVVAQRLGDATTISKQWLPFVSFLLVFLVVLLLVRLAAKALELSAKAVMLGWANRLGGMIVYAILYTIVFSIVLFYAEEMKWIRPSVLEESRTYSFIQPWAPRAFNALGRIIPWFKDMFFELAKFFDGVSTKIPEHS